MKKLLYAATALACLTLASGVASAQGAATVPGSTPETTTKMAPDQGTAPYQGGMTNEQGKTTSMEHKSKGHMAKVHSKDHMKKSHDKMTK